MQDKVPFDPVRFDLNTFNQFVRSNGLLLQHFKAIPCPIGMSDPLDSRAPNHDHSNCSNGYIYKYAGDVKALTSSNSAISSLQDIGLLDGSIISATLSLKYENTGKQIYAQIYDRFYLRDCAILVPNSQRVEAHITGVDKLTYNAEAVEFVIDSHGKEYGESDYELRDGKLHWTTENRPSIDPETGKGDVYTVRYLYTPYFYVQRMMHEIRVVHNTTMAGPKAERSHYAIVLAREYYLYKEQADSALEDDRRDLPSPRDGLFGPR